MKHLTTFVCAVAVLLGSANSFAKPSSYFKGNINQGHFFLTGSSGLSFSHTNYDGGGSSSVFDLQTTTAYFIDTGLGIGGTVGLRSSDSIDVLSIGPTVVYYLVADDRIGVPVMGSVLFQHYNRASRTNANLALQASIAFQYFITPSISAGPALQIKQVVGDTEGGLETRTLGVLANFSLFL